MNAVSAACAVMIFAASATAQFGPTPRARQGNSAHVTLLPPNQEIIPLRRKPPPDPATVSNRGLVQLPAGWTYAMADSAVRAASRHPARKFDGRIIDLSGVLSYYQYLIPLNPMPEWQLLVADVISVVQEGLILRPFSAPLRGPYWSDTVFLTNHPHVEVLIDGDRVSSLVTRTGRYQYVSVGGAVRTIEMWDFGEAPTAEELQPLLEFKEAEAKRLREENELRQREITNALFQATARKQREKDQRIVAWQQAQATNGSGYAQAELGFRYLEGRGVEKDPQLALQWLQRACTNGQTRACNALTNFSLSAAVQ